MNWQFDKFIAEVYLDHVQKHIPDFEDVINKTLLCCQKTCNINDPILDFGCATGYTLNRLEKLGFTNLYGIDCSQDMLDKCSTNATLWCRNDIPNMKFKTLIANWSLHFNKNKRQLLENIYNSLDTNGILILSEKLTQSNFVKDQYYAWKRGQGVSNCEIAKKEESLRGIMYCNDISYYYNELERLGFESIDIIHSSWGFVTICAIKKPISF